MDYDIDVINFVPNLNHLLCQKVNGVHSPCIKRQTSKLVFIFFAKPFLKFEEDPWWDTKTKNSMDQLVAMHDLEKELGEKTISPNIDDKYPKLLT